MNLGVKNQVEDISENGIHLEEPMVHDVGPTYVFSSTYRNPEAQQWVSKSKNEQITLGIINKLNNREGSSVLDGKQKIALSTIWNILITIIPIWMKIAEDSTNLSKR